MKRVSLIATLLLFVMAATAQQKSQPASGLAALHKSAQLEARYKQELVRLALAYTPTQEEYKARTDINKYETNVAKSAWLNHFNAAGNLNEYSIKGNQNQYNTFFPRYNFGVLLPLGNLIAIPNQVKIAKTNKKVLTAQKRADSIQVKVDVLKAYEIYSANEQLMELQIPVVSDATTNYQVQEEKFGKGEITVEEYNAAYRIYNTEKATAINLKRELEKSRIDLEGMIGTTLEAVLLTVQ